MLCGSMQRLGSIIYHSVSQSRDWASLYIILHLYARTGIHYISFFCSIQRLGHPLYTILPLKVQRLGFIIYHSVTSMQETGLHYISFLPLYSEIGLHFISFCPLYEETGLHYISLCRSMQRLGFSMCYSAAQYRDWASFYIILPLYAETGLHYISLYRSIQRLGFSICIILSLYDRDWSCIIYHYTFMLYAETGQYVLFCRSIQRLGFIIYHSAALCRDWTSLYIILPHYAETGFIIYHSASLCRDWASLYVILSLYVETGLHYISFCRSIPRLSFIIYHSAALC